jgi:hypothetical protein
METLYLTRAFDLGQEVPVLDRRLNQRHVAVILVAKLSTGSINSICRIRNISTSGALLESNLAFPKGQTVTLELRSDLRACGQVMWTKRGQIGVKFQEAIEVARYLLRPENRVDRIRARAPRYQCQAPAGLEFDGHRVACSVYDISLSGAGLGNFPTGLPLRHGLKVKLLVEGISSHHAMVVWNTHKNAGIRFRQPIRYTELQNWLELNQLTAF